MRRSRTRLAAASLCYATGSVAWAGPTGGTRHVANKAERNGIVREFYNPARAGEGEEFIAALTEMTRVPVSFTTSWLKLGQLGID